MKKMIIVASLIGFVGITGVVLLKNKKTQSEASLNSTNNVVNSQNNAVSRNNTNGIPMNPDNRIMINPNMPSPEGANRLPRIIPPTNGTQIRVGAPPEANLMRDCQVLAKGNHEVMRKCFEAKIQSNLMTGNMSNSNADVAKYNLKVADCKSKSGNNLNALQLCLNTQGVSNNAALNQEAPSTTFVNATQAAQNKPPVAPNPHAVFK
jgi:hypothetical protein